MKKAYSGKGDEGFTTTFHGKKVPKDDVMIVIQSKIDMLQAVIDIAIVQEKDRGLKDFLEKVQGDLVNVAFSVSKEKDDCDVELLTELDLKKLESFIDSLGEPPKKFIRFRTREAVILNECRVRCRELETILVKLFHKKVISPAVFKYVNRLSSLFFMMAYLKGK